MSILNKIIQFFTRVKNWLIGGFTSKEVSIVLNANHSVSKLEQFKELYQEFGSICDNAYEPSNLGLKIDLTKLDLSNFKIKYDIEPIKLGLSNFDFNSHLFPSLNLNSRSKPTEVQSSIRSFIEHRNFLYFSAPINTWEFELHVNVREQLCVFASKGSWDDIERIEKLLKYDLSEFRAYPPGIILHLAIHNNRPYPIIKLLLNYSEKLFTKDEYSKASYQLALKSKPVRNLFHRDPEFYSRFIQNLFHYDPELCKEIRREKHGHNMEKLSETSEISSILPKNIFYMVLPEIDGPVSTLKELSVMKISKLCLAARTT
ncbi:MAG: hypothetical protein U0X86_000902 [Wolbachia endosymbiont of Xenopsylla cheopis]